jgi:hypothetical protein
MNKEPNTKKARSHGATVRQNQETEEPQKTGRHNSHRTAEPTSERAGETTATKHLRTDYKRTPTYTHRYSRHDNKNIRGDELRRRNEDKNVDKFNV